MRLVITTMAWGRYDLLTRWAKHIKRLKKELSKEVEITGHICGSEIEAYQIAKQYKFKYVNSINIPLGRKANVRLLDVKQYDPDVVLFLGSDDFITADTIRYELQKIKEGFDEVCPIDIYYANRERKRGLYSPGYVNHRKGEGLAVGRMLTKKMLNKVGWELWESIRKKGIDADARNRLMRIPHKRHLFSLKEEGLMIVDVKTFESLSPFVKRPHFEEIPYPYITNRINEII
jgi:hypothetical protein